MKVNVFTNKNPSQLDLKKFEEFSNKNWGKHYESKEERKEIYFATPKYVVLAYTGIQLIGKLDIYIRKAYVGSSSFSVGGIGGVVTHKEFRRKKIATKILKESIKLLKLDKIDVAMLTTDIPKLGGLYSKVGFVPLGKPYYFYAKNGDEKAVDSGMIAPVSSIQVFQQVLSATEKIHIGHSNF
jgi:predicted acetyltransferase